MTPESDNSLEAVELNRYRRWSSAGAEKLAVDLSERSGDARIEPGRWHWVVVELCTHKDWRALGRGERDPDSGRFLGRTCACIRCGQQHLFKRPPNGCIGWH